MRRRSVRKRLQKFQWADDQRSGDFPLTSGPSILNRIGGDAFMITPLARGVKRWCKLPRDFSP
jgi:hypothetical protein